MGQEKKSIFTRLLEYIYVTSKQPILLKDMLVASRQFYYGMEVDSSRLGFRLRLTRAYFVYIILVLLILIPISLATHKTLAIIDSHVSIMGAMVVTALIFMGFNYFKDFIKNSMVKISLKKAWKLHFPFFSYDEYGKKVNTIFENAMKEEIPKKELQKYILDKLSKL